MLFFSLDDEEGSVIIAVGERELGDGREAGLEETEALDEDAIDGCAENKSREDSPVHTEPTSPGLSYIFFLTFELSRKNLNLILGQVQIY